jgi:membrane-anchored glycerophosphoryl diester phosphodiesterase (GDPDase)
MPATMSSGNVEKSDNPQTIEISVEPSITSGTADDNYELYKRMRDVEIDLTQNKKVLQKVDMRILSVLVVTYFLQYLDKNCINIASVYGLETDNYLKGLEYSWLSISLRTYVDYLEYFHLELAILFYIGYLGFQFPFGYLLQHLPIGRLLSVTTFC